MREEWTTTIALSLLFGLIFVAVSAVAGAWRGGQGRWSGRMGSVVVFEPSSDPHRATAYFLIDDGWLITQVDLEILVPGGIFNEFTSVREKDLPEWSSLDDWRDRIRWTDGFHLESSVVGVGFPFVGVVMERNLGSSAMLDKSKLRLRALPLTGNFLFGCCATALCAIAYKGFRRILWSRQNRCIACGYQLMDSQTCSECGHEVRD